jgi:hypothetical protein
MEALVLPNATQMAAKGSHRRCARCGKVVSSRALVCRRCGKKQRINPRSTLLFVAGMFLVALFGVATVTQRFPFLRARDVMSAASSSLKGAPARAAARPAPPAGVMTAIELWGLYAVDRPRADARFKDKTFAVTGEIADVRRDFRGNILLRLVAGDSFETVRATVVNHDYAGVGFPGRGQTVTLRCTGRGALIGSPLLDNCAAI